MKGRVVATSENLKDLYGQSFAFSRNIEVGVILEQDGWSFEVNSLILTPEGTLVNCFALKEELGRIKILFK